MKKSSFLWGCLLVAGLFILILAVAGGWWFFRSQVSTAEFKPESPVLVFLLSPSSGDEIKAGDLMPVKLQAAAPTTILKAELFVDGQSLGTVTDSPESAEWVWQAFPLGIHTLQARVTAQDGQTGQSQTVIVNVLAGDGVMQIAAEEGQTLTQIGANFGIPPDQMISANPHVDPTQPLQGGQPVQAPIPPNGGAGQGDGQGQSPVSGGADTSSPISIIWDIKFTEPVDKSYCYVSSGGGVWEKMPKNPFDFFQGTQNIDISYTQVLPPLQQGVLQVDCWGWLKGVLKYLGQGKAGFDAKLPPQTIDITADGFHFTGKPNIPVQIIPFTDDGSDSDKTIPPPFAVRFTTDAKECTSHANPLLAPFICNTLLNNPSSIVKSYNILVWEWKPPICWGKCPSVDKVDGYRIYEIIPEQDSTPKYLKEVSDPQKVVAIPLGWGAAPCYGVRAYVNNLGESEMVTTCSSQPPTPKKITLTPINWLTAGGTWMDTGDCDAYGAAEYYVAENNSTGFGNKPGEVMVGSYIFYDDDDCFRQGEHYGAVKFDSVQIKQKIPLNAVIQKAELKYSRVPTKFGGYEVTGLATNWEPSCVLKAGKAKQDWTGLVGGNHYSSKGLYTYFAPYVDITWVVRDWFKNPASNHGLILLPVSPPDPMPVEDWDGTVTGKCFDGLSNFELVIYYFAP